VEFDAAVRSAVEKPDGDTCEHNAVGHRKEWFVDSSWRPPQCGAVHATNDSVIPCQLEPSHDGDHYSTSGCAGGGFKWSDRPPLELPTEPTWGIAIRSHNNGYAEAGQFWEVDDGIRYANRGITGTIYRRSDVSDFIPLTDEQVKRIEDNR
jgi:hypothetical protein